MLRFRFCPRLRDFPDRRLVWIAPPTAYPALAPLLGKKVRADVLREHWGEILRLVAWLKTGHAAPSAMLKTLAAQTNGRTSSTRSRRRSGKMERTLFMLDWLENPALRQRCQAGLNKSDSTIN